MKDESYWLSADYYMVRITKGEECSMEQMLK